MRGYNARTMQQTLQRLSVVAIILFIAAVLYSLRTLDTTPERAASLETATSTSSGLTFTYPTTLGTTYIATVDWPPKFLTVSETLSCTEAGIESDRAGGTEKRIIDGRSYCVTTVAEGAAGSVYRQYAYAFAPDDAATTILTFSLRFPQCGNYEESEMRACEDERSAFTPDPFVEDIVRSIVR